MGIRKADFKKNKSKGGNSSGNILKKCSEQRENCYDWFVDNLSAKCICPSCRKLILEDSKPQIRFITIKGQKNI